ncbi:S-layer homology domain-containing protein [Paenibacillus hexagrammi]|uniref:S-layer homology domain-containing protein n=1 Tax=Paenibacillus hexagrammi TaxID=2908839 RepID=A0ABY3SM70_9BACL|nr:S-layer homology domain-containing protein [Paenibacillus sp. YPD9-1]UJF34573.1 S-layer homology domain-containing protein [Paenibacillus sp. YPD9-1]
MTMKKKLTVTTLAASMVFASVAGLPLSGKGLASKLGVSVAFASEADSAYAEVTALHDELAKDTAGFAKVKEVRDFIKTYHFDNEDTKYQLIKEVWDKIEENRNASAPDLNYDTIFQLVSGLDLFYDGSGAVIEDLMNDTANRKALDDLFKAAGLPGIDDVDGLKVSSVTEFQNAMLKALKDHKSDIYTSMITFDSEAMKDKLNQIVTADVINENSNLLISKLLVNYNITLGDINAVQNRIANFIDGNSNVDAKGARTALESAGFRYLLASDINGSEGTKDTTASYTPKLKVIGVEVPNLLLTWSAEAGTPISFVDGKFVLSSSATTASTARIEARDNKMGLLLYISSLTLEPVASTDGDKSPSPGGGGGGAPSAADTAKSELNKLKDQLKDASPEKKQEIMEQARAKVKEALKQISKVDLKSSIKVENGTAKPTINVADMVSKIKDIAAQMKSLNDSLKELDPNAKEEKVTLSLDLGTISAKTAEVPLAKELLEAAKENGISLIDISLNGLTLGVSPSEFSADTTLKVTNQEKSVATSVTELPVASGVYEFEFTSGGNKVGSFSTPVEVSIPVPNGDAFDTDLLTLAKIVDGKLEFYGGKFEKGILNAVRNSFSTYTVVENKVSFDDTASVKAWAGRQIQVAAAKGIVEGRGDQQFDPNGLVTRAEFAKMIVKTFGLENAKATESFDDVADGDWYQVYVASAVKSGIVNGREAGQFDPNGLITRAEMATMASRALALKGASLSSDKVEEALKNFADADSIHSSLKNGVALAASEGIVVGEENNTFNPNANSTRAQAAVVIYRLLNK